MRSLRPLAAAVLLALGVSACGGGNTGAGTSAQPTASAPEATAPPPDATQPGTTAVTPPPQTTPPQTAGGEGDANGGASDEQQPVRVPASFVVAAGGRLTPPVITVPPLLAVEISVRADDGTAHVLVLRTPTPQRLDVAAGERAAVRIPGLRAGRYPVTLDGRRAGALVAGGEVGP